MKTILIIDDNENFRLVLSDWLDYKGFSVLSAENGHDGCALAQSHFPDLILCDLNMPGMDGFEVLNVIREDTQTAHIPFFFVTSDPRCDRAHRLGADGVLTKPIELDVLDKLLATQTRSPFKLKV